MLGTALACLVAMGKILTVAPQINASDQKSMMQILFNGSYHIVFTRLVQVHEELCIKCSLKRFL